MTLFLVVGGAEADHRIFNVNGVPVSIQGTSAEVETYSRQFAGYALWDDEAVPHHLAPVQCRVSLQSGCEKTLVTCLAKKGPAAVSAAADGDIPAVARRLASKPGRH